MINLTDRFEQALVYAHRLHSGQYRKGSNTPYMGHLLGVTALVIEDGGDEDQVIAALLHDAVEDRGGDRIRQEIRRRFGERVTAIVDGCTDTDETPKPPWKERKERFLEKFSHASPEVLRVCLADKLHNLRSLLADYRLYGDRVWSFFKGGRDGTIWYHESIVKIARQRGIYNPLLEELARVLDELKRASATVEEVRL